MKNKGAIVWFTAILALVCIYQLSFTFVTRNVEKNQKESSIVNGKLDNDLYRHKLDSMSHVTVYNIGIASYTYAECKEKELNLGLDLRGGMNIILEVSSEDVIKGLAGANGDDKDLLAALLKAKEMSVQKEGDFVDYFAQSFKEIAPNRNLASLFASRENSEDIKYNSTDRDVINFLKKESKQASDRSLDVIETRINQSNVTQPNIQRVEGGRISVELPGVDNPEQIRRMLQESAKLEFWEVYGNNQKNEFAGFKMIDTANNILKSKYGVTVDADTSKIGTDSTQTDSTQNKVDESSEGALFSKNNQDKDTSKVATQDSLSEEAKFKQENPLYTYLYPAVSSDGQLYPSPYVGYAKKENMAKIEELLNDPAVRKVLPRNVQFAWGAEPMGKNSDIYAFYLLKPNKQGKAALGGDIIVDARPSTSQTGQIEISMKMNDVGAREWRLITKAASVNQDFIAVVLDGKVYTAPTVNSEIPNGMSVITGSFDLKEAQFISNILKAGKLPAPARIVAEDVVGPTLGQESITQGTVSLIIGFLSVVLVMLLYYARGGWTATVVVMLNMFFIVGILASYGAALTLPGIAGLILTIGMAVDANVLIFERIKEELRMGKTLKTAIHDGYKAAMPSILDGNITTLLVGIIMLFSGAGPVYGFAIILIIGILSSLFTSILVTRVIVDRRLEKHNDYKIAFSYSTIGQNSNFDFVKTRKYSYIFSWVLIASGIVAIAMGNLSSGIDFKGGWSYRVQLDKSIPSVKIKDALDQKLPGSSNEVKTIGSDNRYKIVTSYMIESSDPEVSKKVQADLVNALSEFGLTDKNILSSTKVGATVASSIRSTSTIIIIISLIGMALYIFIRFKTWSYSLGAIIATIHDVLAIFSVYALFGPFLPFSTEIDQTFIAAVLTIIGYSINDTVVVFDRLREYLTQRRSEDVPTLVNKAINSTLSRTIMTAFTTIIVVIILFLFGGEALKGFSFVIIIGIAFGTYSSIFVATPIMMDISRILNKRKKIKE